MDRINISIDDMSPHPNSSIKVLDQCQRLIDADDSIKFTLFVPMMYTRLNEKTYDVRDYPEFCKVLHNLPKDHYELGWHGAYHGLMGKSNNDEFRYLNKDEALKVFDLMFSVAKEAGIYKLFKPIFRPSAFRMSSGAIEACQSAGMKVLALSRHISYEGADKGLKSVIYYDCNPPFAPLKVEGDTEIVYHALEKDKNCLNGKNTDELLEFLGRLPDVRYVFMEEYLGEDYE